MLRKAAGGKFTAIISLDGLIEAAFHTHCLLPACKELSACVHVCGRARVNNAKARA